ncbi:MAG: hypothetical protein LBK52_06895 [Deltaproteobacteria bacterium]|jgi:hypothetical protein|nr:hypothetical protein [Deltaproteobacteria bacterium]
MPEKAVDSPVPDSAGTSNSAGRSPSEKTPAAALGGELASAAAQAQPQDQGRPILSLAAQDLANGQLEPASAAQPPARKPRALQWLLLLVPCLAAVVLWGACSVIDKAPWTLAAILLTTGTLLAAVAAFKLLSGPTRAGLAALGLALALALTSLYDPSLGSQVPEMSLPAVLALSLVWTWILVVYAVWRLIGRSVPGLAILLTAMLLYPFLGSGLALYHSLMSSAAGTGLSSLTLETLNSSPLMVTGKLPAFLWPQALMAIIIPLIAAFLVLKGQLALILDRKRPRHLARLFLGLAFLVLVIPGFLTFSPLSGHSDLAQTIRSSYLGAELPAPAASRPGEIKTAAAPAAEEPAPVPAASPLIPETAPAAETPAPTVPLPPNAQTIDGSAPPAGPAQAPAEVPAPVPAAVTEPPAEVQPAAGSEPAPAVQPAAGAEPAPEAQPAAGTEPAPEAQPAAASPASETAPAAVPSEAPAAAPAGDQPAAAIPEGFEALKAELDEKNAQALARVEYIQRLTQANEALEKENQDLKHQIQILEIQNRHLDESSNYLKKLLENMTASRPAQ